MAYKIFICTLLLAVPLLCCGFFYDPAVEEDELVYITWINEYDSSYSEITSLRSLEESSGVIVEGYIDNDTVQIDQRTSNGYLKYGTSVSTLHITRVYKGELAAGDTIPLGEAYYYDAESGRYGEGKTALCYEELAGPTVPGRTYLFFLNKQPEDKLYFGGQYFMVQFHRGRYPLYLPVEGTNVQVELLSAQDMDLLLHHVDSESLLRKYVSIYGEVAEKYMGR